MKAILSDEQKRLNVVQKLYNIQANKKFEYVITDFIIEPTNHHNYKWRHITWKTWLEGSNSEYNTKNIIQNYIDECNKPYGQRTLDFIHLYHNN